jgi:hypothetical protein
VWAITRLYRGDDQLLPFAAVADTQITPNADGESDATRISYELSRDAVVSIYFESQYTGERFYFRQDKLRGAGTYSLLFSGVVDGYQLANEVVEGEILARLLQNGIYTWVVEAVGDDGEVAEQRGELTIVEADSVVPLINGFEIVPTTFQAEWTPEGSVVFSPNRDGIADRLQIQFDLAKEVDSLRVFLETADGLEFPAFEVPREVPKNQAGVHVFDYAGGVDQGATPPPDGVYEMVAFAQDAEGQKIRVSGSVTIQFGGVPRAEIVSPVSADTLQFDMTTVQLCETLHFTITVRNYGSTPIRTTGPEPGTVYDSDWNYNTLDWPTESGAWRLGVGFENELKDYAYRWSVGRREELTKIGDHYYLMPGQQVVISGGIRIVDTLGERNPQPMWAGLIHEDVEISQFNNRRDPHAITIDVPAEGSAAACDAREIPLRVRE